MKSNWKLLQNRSNYHFDPQQWDHRYDTVQCLGRIRPTWSMQDCLEQAEPVTWRTRGSKKDTPQRTSQEHDAEDYDLEIQGYGRDYVISDLTYDIGPEFQRIADLFALENTMARVHVQRPGQVWNLHLDKLEKWQPNDPHSVVRYFVQLTDWQQGHFWSYGNYQYWGWRAGDVTTFDWWNVPHATANAGHSARATLQITGVKTAATDRYLAKLQHETI